jgi:hypothetical protein
MGSGLMEKLLSTLYNDPATGFQSQQKLYKKAKILNPKITQAIVKVFLRKQESAQVNFEAKRPSYHHIVAHQVNNGWQADLIDVQSLKSANSHYVFILTILDIYSRRAWAYPMKSKSAKNVSRAFTDLFKDGNIPEQI